MKFRLALSITLSVFICSAFIKRKSEFIIPKGWPEPKYDFNNFLQAIAQFMLSLTSSESRYDSVMRKQASFTFQEQQGYFIYKSNCANCHKEPLFTNGGFERNGLPPDPKLQDEGRSVITNNKNDSLKFKVPSLRNLEYTAPYMHDGRFKRLQDVISYYTSIQDYPELLSRNDHQQTIKMGEKEKIDLMAFLLTLSDRKFVLNKEHWDPQLEIKSTMDTNKLK